MKTLVLYDSKGGNTEKVAKRIHRTLEETGHGSDLVRVAEDTEIDLDAYDILFMGAPVYALNTNGRLGNIQGRPNAQDLQDLGNRVKGLLASLVAWQS